VLPVSVLPDSDDDSRDRDNDTTRTHASRSNASITYNGATRAVACSARPTREYARCPRRPGAQDLSRSSAAAAASPPPPTWALDLPPLRAPPARLAPAPSPPRAQTGKGRCGEGPARCCGACSRGSSKARRRRLAAGGAPRPPRRRTRCWAPPASASVRRATGCGALPPPPPPPPPPPSPPHPPRPSPRRVEATREATRGGLPRLLRATAMPLRRRLPAIAALARRLDEERAGTRAVALREARRRPLQQAGLLARERQVGQVNGRRRPHQVDAGGDGLREARRMPLRAGLLARERQVGQVDCCRAAAVRLWADKCGG